MRQKATARTRRRTSKKRKRKSKSKSKRKGKEVAARTKLPESNTKPSFGETVKVHK